MSLDQILNLLVTTTLIAMMVTVGLQVTVTELAHALADHRTLLRAGIANYLFVPALTILLLVGFDANPMVAAGFLVLAVFSGRAIWSAAGGNCRRQPNRGRRTDDSTCSLINDRFANLALSSSALASGRRRTTDQSAWNHRDSDHYATIAIAAGDRHQVPAFAVRRLAAPAC